MLLLLYGSISWAQSSYEYRRPATDADSTNNALGAAACNDNVGTNSGSSSNSAVYTGKTGPGPTGSIAAQGITNTTYPAKYRTRVFTTWQAAGNSYSNLTINVNVKCAITDGGDNVGGLCGAAYSTDGGSTWTTIYSYGSESRGSDSPTTYTANITGTPLGGVQVGVCALAAGDYGGQGTGATITTYDIWTTGTVSSVPTGYVIRPYQRN